MERISRGGAPPRSVELEEGFPGAPSDQVPAEGEESPPHQCVQATVSAAPAEQGAVAEPPVHPADAVPSFPWNAGNAPGAGLRSLVGFHAGFGTLRLHLLKRVLLV